MSDLSQSVTPRDIFGVLMHDKKPPIRGWGLEFRATGITTEGAIDYNEWVITATKSNRKCYFHASVRSGGDEDTAQSLYEVRVKAVSSPDEDWNHNFYWDEGAWSGAKGKSAHWVPFKDDPTQGTCSTPGGGMSWAPATKKACFGTAR